MSPRQSPAPPTFSPGAERRRDELSTTLTILRLRTQLLQRLAQQKGAGWPRMVDGLAAIDADLATLLRQLDAFEPSATR